MTDDKSRLEQLGGELNAASGIRWRAIVGYCTLGLYLFLAGAGTSHEQLLFGRSVKLPLIEVEVTLATFYIVAPILFVLLYVYASIQFVLLKQITVAFDTELRATIPIKSERRRRRAAFDSNFLFSSLAKTDASFGVRALSLFFLWIAFIAAPFVVLLGVQVALLPVHSEWITWTHRGLVVVVALTVLALPTLHSITRVDGRLRHSASKLPNALAALTAVIASFAVILMPEEPLEHLVNRWLPNSWRHEVTYSGDSLTANWDPPTLRRWVPAVTYYFFEAAKTPLSLRRNLLLSRVNTVTAAPTDAQIGKMGEKIAWDEFGRGINLSGRNLAFADLSGANLRKADLRGASLRGANLSGAKLDYAIAETQTFRDLPSCAGVALPEGCVVDFSGARFKGASARFADFLGARMFAVDASNTDLESANFFFADLDLASFYGSKLYYTDLRYARAEGTSFVDASLDLGNLENLKALAADFSSASLMEVSFRESFVAGAVFRGSNLIGTDFSSAKMTAATFSSTRSIGDLRNYSGAESAELDSVQFGPISKEDVERILGDVANRDVANRNIKDVLRGRLMQSVSRSEAVAPKVQTTSKRKKRSAGPAQSESTLKTESVSRKAEPERTSQLEKLVCVENRDDVAIALGVLRQISREETLERNVEIVESEPGAPPHEGKWKQLLRKLEDPKGCGSVSEVVARHDARW